ncbi:pantetheine-phosphate adenylyltransferase [Aureimonas psammosilenae]|uniref:pantetheine-phosphate adenylyltransferase n=1 Tax=Aureimonas psammosilenae TaxID=2495496 RepID=UPI002E271B78|nr:pantetheine-phosphate adenylyltransferase [Aureimonas psammosilenae]
MRTGLYPGSFDPFTLGHLDILRRSCALFDRVIVGIGVHHGKAPMLDFDTREKLIEEVAEGQGFAGQVRVESFSGLVVMAAEALGAATLIRGIRDGTDLDYEMQMAGMNAELAPSVRTIFLPSSPAVRPITATLVRQIAAMGGDITPFVPPCVAEALRTRQS